MTQGAYYYHYNEGTAAVQTEDNTIVVDHSGEKSLQISTTLDIKGIVCDARHVVIWSETKIQIHRIFDSHTEIVSELQPPHNVKSAELYKDILLIVNDNHLQTMSFGGEQRCIRDFSSEEGFPILTSNVNINSSIAVVTERDFLKVLDVTNAETINTREQQPSKRLHEYAQDIHAIGQIMSVKCNATASLISIASANEGTTHIFVFNMIKNELKLVHSDNSGSTMTHCWDPAEPRLLACDIISCTESNGDGNKGSDLTLILFIDEDGSGIYQHEQIRHPKSSKLIGIDAPYVVYSQENGKISNQVMSGFVNLEDESPLALAAMLDFMFYSCSGDKEKSAESLQAIKSPRFWANLAPTCINMKRLDIAEMCMSHTASSEGMSALEMAKQEPEVEVALATAAIQFGLFENAKLLYIECKRHDLLNQMLQKLGEWDTALNIAETDDRVHLELTKYNYVQYLESSGQFDKAIEVSGKYTKNSLKFGQLIRERRFDELENFVSQQNDPELYTWFGQLNHSLGNIAKAQDYFLLAGNDLKLVELHCSEGAFEEARRIVDETGNGAAAYYLAKFYSGAEAVKLYSLGGMLNHAMRIAMENELDAQLLEISQKCNSEQASVCARYFDQKGSYLNAIELYKKSGQWHKALAMCTAILTDRKRENKEVEVLFITLVNDHKTMIPPDLSKQVIARLQHIEEIDLMLDVLCLTTRDPKVCIQFCHEHNVQLTEAITAKLLSFCTHENESEDQILRDTADLCCEQGNYKLACEMYRRLGENKHAIKCLFQLGDVNSIIAYANDAESKSVCALAASYLQKITSNHSGSENSTSNDCIIRFYTKAEKYDKLVTFLISQSQLCVEQNGDYSTSIRYLKQALSFSSKLHHSAEHEIKKLIGERLSTMEWFEYAKESYSTMDRLSLENLCLDLLSPPQFNQIIRAGDCYALLIRFFLYAEQFQTAHDYIQTMQSNGLDPYLYMEKSTVKQTLQKIHGNGGDSSDDES